ncbi:unnamed protein product [Strongylus vulgaris]|uniref:Uncharacterized protein n=1 Tax=Strongylus vulgaris TaxID=40348 RepID=A0A3P7I986_STRVU|nr:unnamed protein product [Strongylus vulgaris]
MEEPSHEPEEPHEEPNSEPQEPTLVNVEPITEPEEAPAVGAEPTEPQDDSADIMDQVFGGLPSMAAAAPVNVVVEPPTPLALEKTEELPHQDMPAVERKSTHESAAEVAEPQTDYVPAYQTQQRHDTPPTTQISPPSNGSSLNGYPNSTESGW